MNFQIDNKHGIENTKINHDNLTFNISMHAFDLPLTYFYHIKQENNYLFI